MANPGIERGLTATSHHTVNSVLHVGMPWFYAEALAITLQSLLSSGKGVAPSHLQAIQDIHDLLWERVRVLRTVREETPEEYRERVKTKLSDP